MTEIVGDSGVTWKSSDFDEREIRALQREQEKERRRIMTERLHNWGAWYQREHKSEIDRASGQIKENTISRLIKSAIGIKKDEDQKEIDDEDAITVYEAVKMLKKTEHIALLQWRFLDRYTIEAIAKQTKQHLDTIKLRQRKAIDCLILELD